MVPRGLIRAGVLLQRVAVNHPYVIREGNITSQVWEVIPESPVRNRGEIAIDTSNTGSKFTEETGLEMSTTMT